MLPTRFSILAHRSLPCHSSLSVHRFAPARAAFSTSVACRHTSAASTVAQNVQRTEQTTTTSSPKKSGKSLKSARTKTIEPEDTSFEEQARYLDQVHAMELKAPYDIWARPVGLFGGLPGQSRMSSNITTLQICIYPRGDLHAKTRPS